MDALERVLRICSPSADESWPPDRFQQAAVEGKRRWQEIEELFDIQYPMFKDAVSVISPSFHLPPDEQSRVLSAVTRNMPWIAVSFIRWDAVPKRRDCKIPMNRGSNLGTRGSFQR